MTCIVGVTDGKTVIIGGDSAGSSGTSISIRGDKKVFINSGFLIGFTSSFRMGQILQYSFKPPRFIHGDDVFEYMVSQFIPEVISSLGRGGFMKSINGENTGGSFLVGFSGNLFCVESDFQVGWRECGYEAIGSGDDVALGALHALRDRGAIFSEDMVNAALNAASAHNSAVAPPFTIMSI